MSAPKWAVGMERIGLGIYVDQHKTLHIDERELCESQGYPYTEHNAELLRAAAIEAMQQWKGLNVEFAEEAEH